MLARKLKLTLNGLEVGSTPMLVPSVSSRVNLPMKMGKFLQIISEVIDGPLLISAYDYHYLKNPKISFPDLIFLDSGGYECSKDHSISEIGLYKPDPHDWDEELYAQVINEWSIKIPTVLISYDHPSKSESIQIQIERANDLFQEKDEFLKEILIKPETERSKRINIEGVIDNIESLNSFDILGFTEKELGNSVLDKMTNIAKIRNAMDDQEMKTPIHIFGSLDTITTPLYYLSGADIFDGLSWLRFVFNDGNTLYIDSFGPKLYSAGENVEKIWIQSLYKNKRYLMELTMNLRKFQSKGGVDKKSFDIFPYNAEFFKKTYDDLLEKIRE